MPRRSDGVRISVMSRHTLSDGVTPDSKITSSQYGEWSQVLAPSGKLVGGHYKKELSWTEFEKAYEAYLEQPKVADKVKELAERAFKKDITLLCVEEVGEPCHRRILAKECQMYVPDLVVVHF